MNADNEEFVAKLDAFLPKLVMVGGLEGRFGGESISSFSVSQASSGLSLPMKMIMDDPSGNSFVENLKAPQVSEGLLRTV